MSFAKPRLTPKLGRRNTDPVSSSGPDSSASSSSSSVSWRPILPKASFSAQPRLSGLSRNVTPAATPSVNPRSADPPTAKPPMLAGPAKSRRPHASHGSITISASATKSSAARVTPDQNHGAGEGSSIEDSLGVLSLNGNYLQSEWMLWAARENAQQIRHAWDKEHVQMRTALSEALAEKTRLEIELDRLQYLTLFASTKAVENETRVRLLQVLPETAKKMHIVARALERAQTYLAIQGVSSASPEDFSKLKAQIESRQSAFAEIIHHLQDDNSREMAAICQEVRDNLKAVQTSRAICQTLVQELDHLSTREASLKLSQTDTVDTPSEPVEDDLELVIPPRIPQPKLIDF